MAGQQSTLNRKYNPNMHFYWSGCFSDDLSSGIFRVDYVVFERKTSLPFIVEWAFLWFLHILLKLIKSSMKSVAISSSLFFLACIFSFWI